MLLLFLIHLQKNIYSTPCLLVNLKASHFSNVPLEYQPAIYYIWSEAGKVPICLQELRLPRAGARQAGGHPRGLVRFFPSAEAVLAQETWPGRGEGTAPC